MGLRTDGPEQGLGSVVGGHHDHPGLRRLVTQAREDREAVHPRHPHVEQDEVEFLAADAGEGGGAVSRGFHGVAGRAKLQPKQLAGRAVVVDYEDPGH